MRLRGWPATPFDACVAVHADLDREHGAARGFVRMNDATAITDSVRIDVGVAD